MIPDKKIKIIHISGAGRSGSTLLDLILGKPDNHFSTGELIYIWHQGFVLDDPCSCRKNFSECEFWTKVIKDGFDDANNIDVQEMLRLRKSVSRVYNIPFLIIGWGPKKFRQDLKNYSDALSTLYVAISRVSGCDVIIDSSKYAAHSFITRKLTSVDTYTIQLVRDSRAVAYSWQKHKLRHGDFRKNDFMQHYSPTKSAWLWMRENLLLQLYRFLYPSKSFLMKYEDIVSNPTDALSRIFKFIREPDEVSHIIQDDEVLLSSSHTLSGNPLRFRKGKIAIRLDDEWKEKMSRPHKRLVMCLTLPLLLFYGYLR